MAHQCDLQINVNGQQTFFLNQEIVSTFSKKLRKMIKQEKKKTQMKNVAFIIEDFPGGSNGFELVAKFCYNFGKIHITVANISNLYCASNYLSMTHKVSSFNLVQQVEAFLEGMFDWSWIDVLISVQNCEPFFHYADSSGLIDKLITNLLAKIAQNSDISLILSSNSSSSSSPESTMVTSNNPFARSNSSAKTTPDKIKRLSSTSNHSSTSNNNKAWWFDDLSTFSPRVIEKVIRTLGAYGSDNNSLLLTKFLLHYLKTAVQTKKTSHINYPKPDYTGLVDTAIYGVILMGKTAFSCRALFGVLRLVSGFGLSNVCRTGLETLIGSTLDSAKLDDLLMFGQTDNETDQGVYDVNLVVRLIRVFVQCEGLSIERLNKVGRLVDQYLAEISPDHNLKISKFIRVAQSLPDLARDCFDGVYRAIDIYLESHPNLSFEERSRLCRCLNYEKLSLEACKDLAKNPRIPPRVAVQALASQRQVNYESPTKADQLDYYYHQSPTKNTSESQMVLYGNEESIQDEDDDSLSEVSQDVKVNIQRMQCRVLELEKLCKEMKGQMSKLVRNNNTKTVNFPTSNRPHRLC
ncbi:BTB/POZ domain-containing protein At3g19850 [Silene latifolia]|uniref:BTB/POZ domain-containing protein At3g19850 n=1 Tax=Silene latifolia TaxID=37657 RepID=UPI003D77E760